MDLCFVGCRLIVVSVTLAFFIFWVLKPPYRMRDGCSAWMLFISDFYPKSFRVFV
ncbi:hypothetical protein HanRHA438_Chr10g0464351 [Helianthus annuus]|nr:hypothetical protein HanRHA438_Chr10g0464351 [Helianthus annuus]